MLAYFNTVKSWVLAGSWDSSVFSAPEVQLLKKGIVRTSSHIPVPASPPPPADFKRIILFLTSLHPTPFTIIVALLLAYFTLLRQSNLLCPSNALGPHALRFKDVLLTCDQ